MMPVATIGNSKPVGWGFSDIGDAISSAASSTSDFVSDQVSLRIDMSVPGYSDLFSAARTGYDTAGNAGDKARAWLDRFTGKKSETPTETTTNTGVNWLVVGVVGVAAFFLLKK